MAVGRKNGRKLRASKVKTSWKNMVIYFFLFLFVTFVFMSFSQSKTTP